MERALLTPANMKALLIFINGDLGAIDWPKLGCRLFDTCYVLVNAKVRTFAYLWYVDT